MEIFERVLSTTGTLRSSFGALVGMHLGHWRLRLRACQTGYPEMLSGCSKEYAASRWCCISLEVRA